MVVLGSIVIRVDDLDLEAVFWEEALRYERRIDRPGDFVQLGPREATGPTISLDKVSSPLAVPPRIHLDLYTEDQGGEVRRLLALGAREISWDKKPEDADYVIMEDPEGNRFCVVDVTR